MLFIGITFIIWVAAFVSAAYWIIYVSIVALITITCISYLVVKIMSKKKKQKRAREGANEET
jgi:membrane protein implicated in regulation of membrane protease activity